MNQLRLRCPVVQLFVPVTQPGDIISRNKWSLMNTSDTQSSFVLMLNVQFKLFSNISWVLLCFSDGCRRGATCGRRDPRSRRTLQVNNSQ